MIGWRWVAACVGLAASAWIATTAQAQDAAGVRAERPATVLEAIRQVRAEAESHLNDGDYFALMEDAFGILTGNAVARRYFDNWEYGIWLGVSFGSLLAAQTLILLAFGYRVRLMSMALARRPLGVVLVGLGFVVGIVPATGILYVSMAGIPFAAALWAFAFLAAMAGKIALFLSVGSLVLPFFGSRSPLPFYPAYLAYGALVFFNPYAIGTAAFLIVNALAVGVAARTGFGFAVRALSDEEKT